MIRLLPLPFLLALPASALTPQQENAAQVPAARAILDGWQNQKPERAERKLHIVYWTPSDREPAPRYRERLSTIMEDIRKFYAEQMEKTGFGPRTFNLDHAADGLINIHVVKGKQPYAHYSTPSGGEIRDECKGPLKEAGLDIDNETIVLFCNMSNWDPEKRIVSQNSPYYASGTNRNGTAWQVDSPILELSQLTNKGDNVKDGQDREHLPRPLQFDLHRWHRPRAGPRPEPASQQGATGPARQLRHRPDGLRQPRVSRGTARRGPRQLHHAGPRAAPRLPSAVLRIGEGHA
ncbi:MAG: hypothetical protein QM755_01465 [Luteolibacter sp.]